MGILTDLAMLVTFVMVLWTLSTPLDFTLLGHAIHPQGRMTLGYAIVGTLLTFVIGRPLVKLNFNQQRYEADFRFSLIRLREKCRVYCPV